MKEKTEIEITITIPVKGYPGKSCEWCGFDGSMIDEDPGSSGIQILLFAICLPAVIFFPMAVFVPLVYLWYRWAYPRSKTCPSCGKRTELVYSYLPD